MSAGGPGGGAPGEVAPGESAPGGAARAAAAMSAAMFFFALLDAAAKHLGSLHAVPLVVFARYASHLVFSAALLAAAGRLRSAMRSERPGLQLLRSLNLFAVTLLFFTALVFLPFAETIAIMLTTPLIVTVLSALLLGERVGPRRATGVLAGLAGALVVARPGSEAFQPAALLALAAAIGYATYQILTRRLAAWDPPATTGLYTSVVGTAASALMLPAVALRPVGGAEALLFASLGANALVAHGLLVLAFSAAPASLVTGFGYLNIVWVGLLGWLLFDEVPDPATWAGIGIICAGGLYLLRREAVRGAPHGQHARSGIAPRPRRGRGPGG